MLSEEESEAMAYCGSEACGRATMRLIKALRDREELIERMRPVVEAAIEASNAWGTTGMYDERIGDRLSASLANLSAAESKEAKEPWTRESCEWDECNCPNCPPPPPPKPDVGGTEKEKKK